MKFKPGDWIRGPFWQDAAQILSVQSQTNHDLVTIHSNYHSQTYIFTQADWQQIEPDRQADRRHITFDGDPERFRLGIEAYRLRLVHAVDPYAALNASRIDPLPHQFEAVYEHLLARPIIRALLAHDAGAGKTIMAGMLIKELKRRQGARRILIVTPAALKLQWRRELLTKFGEDFTIVDRDLIEQSSGYALDVWRETDSAITSVTFARQQHVRRVLENVEWDVVVVDEAHSMAAYKQPNGIRRTEAYRLGEALSRRSTHFILMTATPHKGDPDNYQLLLKLVNPEWGEAAAYASGANPVVLRRTKEEMRKPDGKPLYPERIVETLPFSLSHDEGELLERVQHFLRERYSKARANNQNSAAFALITLERRLASSPFAMNESLRRMKQRAEERLATVQKASATNDQSFWGSWEDELEELAEEDRWQHEAEAENAVIDSLSPRQLKVELRELETLISRATNLLEKGQQAKLKQLRAAVQEWVAVRGEQIIIFTEFKDTLDYLIGQLHEWGFATTQIHGSLDIKKRRQAEKDFWAGDAQILVATEAAGEGINLQCCRMMINFDLPWNPCRLEQRMGRIHRYGQKSDQVFVFNLLATNTHEDQVKEALIHKQKRMKQDLGDKVFDVIGRILWGRDLRQALERIALGDVAGKQAALDLIEKAGAEAQEAIAAEQKATAMATPIDINAFQRKQATFAAQRLSPEAAETFFRQAVPFLDGALQENNIDGHPVFTVTLPPFLRQPRQRRLKLSFWSAVCSDDETEPDAVLFISPGHWLFENLVNSVIERCRDDLNRGAVFYDAVPDSEHPYLVWFVHSHLRNGLDKQVSDVLAAVRHRADREIVTPLATEVLAGFDYASNGNVTTKVAAVQPMLVGQETVVEQCVANLFLPELVKRRQQQQAALARDSQFLKEGVSRLIDALNDAALDAYAAGDIDEGERLTAQANSFSDRLTEMQVELGLTAQLLLVKPEVLGVAAVLPMPLLLNFADEETPKGVISMRRDPEVEEAAMKIVMSYETAQGRHPQDVHQGKSWDIESASAAGRIERYIEVKGRGPKEGNEIVMTNPEWEAARRLGERHWLYIVRLEDNQMWMIQNPHARLQPKELKRWLVTIPEATAHAETATVEKEQAG